MLEIEESEDLADPLAPTQQGRMPPRPRRRVDRAALLLAGGHSIERIAEDQGCPPQVIRRNLRRSRKFRQRIEREHESRRLLAQLRFGAIGENAILELFNSEKKLDSRMLQWLADRLGMRHFGPRKQEAGLAERWDAVMRGQLPAAPGPRIIDAKRLAELIGDDDD